MAKSSCGLYRPLETLVITGRAKSSVVFIGKKIDAQGDEGSHTVGILRVYLSLSLSLFFKTMPPVFNIITIISGGYVLVGDWK